MARGVSPILINSVFFLNKWVPMTAHVLVTLGTYACLVGTAPNTSSFTLLSDMFFFVRSSTARLQPVSLAVSLTYTIIHHIKIYDHFLVKTFHILYYLQRLQSFEDLHTLFVNSSYSLTSKFKIKSSLVLVSRIKTDKVY